MPVITVIGKSNCGKCESAKDKLKNHFHLDYKFVAMDSLNGWRKTNITSVMASAIRKNIDITHPPVIGIDGEAFDYAGAMRKLKELV